jgi:hypothetical protein
MAEWATSDDLGVSCHVVILVLCQNLPRETEEYHDKPELVLAYVLVVLMTGNLQYTCIYIYIYI